MIVSPGSIIGIIGGGQLGRMLALAAAQLGYKCHIYAPDKAPPAADVAALFTQGDYGDAQALGQFGASVDVATYEFENIPAGPLSALATQVVLYPPPRALEVAQDRLREKEFIAGLGGRPAQYAPVSSQQELETAVAQIGVPSILKTRRLGYDGKGQARIASSEEARPAWTALGATPAILEEYIAFDAEFSILLCRGSGGEIVTWDAPHNLHVGGILASCEVPAPNALQSAIEEARDLACKTADALDYTGVLTLEFFAAKGKAIFNELAPRVHNSGHWTIEGALTSQFENHIRAICGLPLGATDLVVPRVSMKNLIGDDVEGWFDLLKDQSAHLHLYGKDEARPGRKMGHVTRLIGS